MNNLIKVEDKVIGSETVQAVSARELHKFLESKQQFADWIKARIKDYDFIENQDFISFRKKMKRAWTYLKQGS